MFYQEPADQLQNLGADSPLKPVSDSSNFLSPSTIAAGHD